MTHPYIITFDSVTVYIDGEPSTILSDNKFFSQIIENIKINDWDKVETLVDQAKVIREYLSCDDGDVTFENGVVCYCGVPTHSVITDKIIQMAGEGFDVKPMMNFLSNLMLNPSHTAIQELYLFLESGHLPITPDGCFLAYKNVKENYYDKHSGTVRYMIGDIPMMNRQDVDDDRRNLCSYGLHFCSIEYLNKMWGHSGRTMVVKIDPADVVSIPADYDNTKGRTWKMEVVGEIDSKMGEFTSKAVFDETVEFNYHNVRDAQGRFTKKD